MSRRAGVAAELPRSQQWSPGYRKPLASIDWCCCRLLLPKSRDKPPKHELGLAREKLAAFTEHNAMVLFHVKYPVEDLDGWLADKKNINAAKTMYMTDARDCLRFYLNDEMPDTFYEGTGEDDEADFDRAWARLVAPIMLYEAWREFFRDDLHEAYILGPRRVAQRVCGRQRAR